MKKNLVKILLLIILHVPIFSTVTCNNPESDKGILDLKIIVNDSINNITWFHKEIEFIKNNNLVTILKSLSKEKLYFNISAGGFINGLTSIIEAPRFFNNNADKNNIYWLIHSSTHNECKSNDGKNMCQVGAADLFLNEPLERFTLTYVPYVP